MPGLRHSYKMKDNLLAKLVGIHAVTIKELE